MAISVSGRRVRGPVEDRSALVLGVDMPGPGLCGLADESLLQTVAAATTTYTSTANGTTVSNQDFNQVKFNGVQNMTLTNCRIKGLTTTPSVDGELVIATNASNYNITFIDCLFEPQNPYWLSRQIRGHGIRLIRCETRHCTDGYAVTNSAGYTGTTDQGVWESQSWRHSPWLASPDMGSAGGQSDNMSHCDLVAQISGGRGMYFGGNRYDGLLGAGLEGVGTQVTSFTDATPLRTGSDGYRMSVDVYTTTLAAAASVGASTISTVIKLIVGQTVKVEANDQRTVTAVSGTGPFTATLNTALSNSHSSGATVTTSERIVHTSGNKYYRYAHSFGTPNVPNVLELDYPLYALATSLFMFSSSIGDLGGFTIEKNWMNGGAVGINLNDYNAAGQPVITPGQSFIRDNIWGSSWLPAGQRTPFFRLGYDYTIINQTAGAQISITGNTRADTGAAFNQVKP